MIEEQVVSAQECREEIQTVDFGKDAFGWLEVELTGKGGEEVELAIGEVIRDGRSRRGPLFQENEPDSERGDACLPV